MTYITRRKFTTLSLATLSMPVVRARPCSARPSRAWSSSAAGRAAALSRATSHKDSNGAIDVTLVEPQKNFTTCFFSNLYVGGFRDFKSITHNYDKVRKAGVHVVHVSAASIDRDKKEVVLSTASRSCPTTGS